MFTFLHFSLKMRLIFGHLYLIRKNIESGSWLLERKTKRKAVVIFTSILLRNILDSQVMI